MSKKHKQVSAFSLEGRFLGFEVEDGYKIKRLQLATAAGDYCIKLSKESRASVGGLLTPGDSIWVLGEKTTSLETGAVKYKAQMIKRVFPGQSLAPNHSETPAHIPGQRFDEPPVPHLLERRKTTILMCQKSDCMKRGGKAVLKALQETLGDRNLEAEVCIKMTGCMKHCKTGPNLVVMPSKTRYSQITAQEIPALIDQHCLSEKSPALPTKPTGYRQLA